MKNIALRFSLAALTFLVGVSTTGFLMLQSDLPLSMNLELQNSTAKNQSVKGEFAELFYALRTDIISKRNETVGEIQTIAGADAESHRRMVAAMIGETAKICSARYLSPADSDEVQTLSFILADWRATEALDVLIDCSDRESAVTDGLSAYDYAAFPGIVRYGQSAIPMLERKLNDTAVPHEIRFRITSALAAIGGVRAERILAESVRKRMGMPASEYFKNCAKRLNSADTPNEVKRRLADELSEIGGSRARRILIEAGKNQPDEITWEYLQLSLRWFPNGGR